MLTIGQKTMLLGHGHEISSDKVMQDAKPCLRQGFTFTVTFPLEYSTVVISGNAEYILGGSETERVFGDLTACTAQHQDIMVGGMRREFVREDAHVLVVQVDVDVAVQLAVLGEQLALGVGMLGRHRPEQLADV